MGAATWPEDEGCLVGRKRALVPVIAKAVPTALSMKHVINATV
jgi:hypothetical protein